MKILIVEDEPKTGDYLRQGLMEAGFVVDLVRDGYDPAVVGEPLYVRDDRAGRYAPLDSETYRAIAEGRHPL